MSCMSCGRSLQPPSKPESPDRRARVALLPSPCHLAHASRSPRQRRLRLSRSARRRIAAARGEMRPPRLTLRHDVARTLSLARGPRFDSRAVTLRCTAAAILVPVVHFALALGCGLVVARATASSPSGPRPSLTTTLARLTASQQAPLARRSSKLASRLARRELRGIEPATGVDCRREGRLCEGRVNRGGHGRGLELARGSCT